MTTLEDATDAVLSQPLCSVVLPAGAGKTHLIVHIARTLATLGKRTLLLTHTNAGVDVLRRRLRGTGTARVRTIAGWALDLISRVPDLAGVRIEGEPDWAQSAAYVDAARDAVCTEPIQDVLRASYDHVLVDEYQDCNVGQHMLICTIAQTLPTAIFGDPLQALFDFGGADTPPAWSDVELAFPSIAVPSVPHRWRTTNPQLGEWLLEIREGLMSGAPIQLADSVTTWIPADAQISTRRPAVCLSQPQSGSVVALGSFRTDCAAVARALNGTYSLMEELEGAVMMTFATQVDGAGPELAADTVDFARLAISGLAEVFPTTKRDRLRRGKPIATRSDQLRPAHDAVNHVLQSPSPDAVGHALRALAGVPSANLYCREAWFTILNALDAVTAAPGESVAATVVRARNLTRITGRPPPSRVVSRPRLVKGLEFDHAVLLDADRYDPRELYVALTRPRRSLTVISAAPQLAN